MKNYPHRVKGFTIVELIIVIAIIGVLAGILVPTMSAYYSKSRVKASNSDAKMVYNAAQTEAQKFIAKDRMTNDVSGMDGVFLVVGYPDGTFSCGNTALTDLSGADRLPIEPTMQAVQRRTFTGSAEEAAAASIAQAVTRTVSNARDKCWAVYIQNYIVKGSIASDTVTSDFVGYYTASKSFADGRSSSSFGDWIKNSSFGGDIDCLADVGNKYDNP